MPATYNQNGGHYGEEDTIVVKGDNYWADPSSPESSPEPEVEPLVANLLRTIHDPQRLQLESPEPEEPEDQTPPTTTITAQQSARQSSNAASRSSRVPAAGTSEERLLQMPELRPLPWREGVDPTSENEVGGDSRRKQIRFGCLLATRGEVQAVPCATCANGRGKFSLCIALDGFFKGACASCQLSGGPNRCTIKKNDEELPDSSTNTPAEKSRQSLGNTKRKSSGEAPPAKRRQTADKVEKVPDWESARPQWQQELGNSQARQQMSQIPQSPWATVNHPVSVPAPQAMVVNGINGVTSSLQYPPDRRNSTWATVNQPVAPPPAIQSYHNGNIPTNGATYRSSVEQAKREDTAPEDDGVPLIDILPKNKQRQLYGLVSGIQGGIKHLQTELDSLKNILGMAD